MNKELLEELFLRNPMLNPEEIPGSVICSVKPSIESTSVLCPRQGCGGTIIKKTSARGREFYGCTNFTVNNCAISFWAPPTGKRCPQCGAVMILDTRATGTKLACSNKGCGFVEAMTFSPKESKVQAESLKSVPGPARESYDRFVAAGYGHDASVLAIPFADSSIYCVWICWEGELLLIQSFHDNGDLIACCRLDPAVPRIEWVSQTELLAALPAPT